MPKDAPIYDLSDRTQRASLIERIGGLRGKHWVEIRKARKQRTMSQNAWYWACVLPSVCEGLEEAWGETLTVEDAHDWLKGRFNSQLLVDRSTGETKGRRPCSTAKLDVNEFTEYLDKVIKFAGEELGVTVPEPASSFDPTPLTKGIEDGNRNV